MRWVAPAQRLKGRRASVRERLVCRHVAPAELGDRGWSAIGHHNARRAESGGEEATAARAAAELEHGGAANVLGDAVQMTAHGDGGGPDLGTHEAGVRDAAVADVDVCQDFAPRRTLLVRQLEGI
eukprot:354666-Prymnesium_polylepis.1